MGITTSAAASVLDTFATQLGQVARAKPVADDFLGEIADMGLQGSWKQMSFREISEHPRLAASWNAMHEAVHGAVTTIDTPTFGTAGVAQARTYLGRLAEANATMHVMKANPGLTRDVAGVAHSIRSRIDDIAERGREGVLAEANLLRAIDGA